MTRVFALAGGLLCLTACMSLDGLAFPAEKLDSYELAFESVPAELVEQVSFETADGETLAGVWARQDPPAPPLIFFHGFSKHIDAYADRVDHYYEWGTHDVFIFDYRGYGMSTGSATIPGVLEEDGLAAVEYVVAATRVDPSDILWVGLSLGGEIALHTNDEIDAQAVVAESCLSSVDDIIDDESGLDLPSGWFFEGEFDTTAAIREIRDPVFLIHGLADDFIDPAYSRVLFDAAPDPKELWQPEGVGHSTSIEVVPDEYRDRILAFAELHAR